MPTVLDRPRAGRDRASYATAADLLRALAHPARLQIAIELGGGDRCVHELVELLDLPQPAVSQHLTVMRAARLVSGRRIGREVRYTLTDHHVGHIAGDAVNHAGETSTPPTDPGRTTP
ncbi:MAG: helix-turn-helix transcriptional regulator [Acidimicrobiia bacterium]|nr:helix-turn-helix transcriptional regulator [Acidimicrobiia bacterium]